MVLAARAGTTDRQIVGTVKAEVPGQELTFRADHTFTIRNGSYRLTGTWSIADNRLTTIATSFATEQERVHRCTYKIERGKLAFAVCDAINKSHGHQVGEPEMYMSSVSYEHVR